jgi:hypothetical protein
MHTYVAIFISWFTLFCRTHLVIGRRIIEDDIIVTSIEPKNELVPRYHLVSMGKISQSRTTKIGPVYLICDPNPDGELELSIGLY